MVSSALDIELEVSMGNPGASQVALVVKKKKKKTHLPMQEIQFPLLEREDPLEKGMATYSSIPAWRIPIDLGTWRTTVHGVTKSWMGLSD